MKRFILSALMLGTAAMFTGCGEEAKKEVKVTTSGPGGSTEKTITEKDKKTGDMKDGTAGTGSTPGTTTTTPAKP